MFHWKVEMKIILFITVAVQICLNSLKLSVEVVTALFHQRLYFRQTLLCANPNLRVCQMMREMLRII